MRAVIMAGGKGTRLHGLTRDEIPKPMAPVHKKPILQWQLECLRQNGIKEVRIVIGHLGGAIRSAFGDGREMGLGITYFAEDSPLGTAGALAHLKDFVGGDDFFLAYGDCVFDIDIGRMAKFHKEKGAEATLFAHPNSHPHDSDLLQIDGNGCVTGIFPKDAARAGWRRNMVNAGAYMLKAAACEQNPGGGRYDLEKDYICGLIPKRRVYGYVSTEYIKDAGTPARLESVSEALRKGIVAARNLRNPQKCVFLDRDGTINRYNGLVSRAEDFELLPAAAEALKALNGSGWLAIVATNQPVVARGLCGIDGVEEIHAKMETLLGESGAYADAVYFCPHHPDKGYPEENPEYKIKCVCRKPGIGMLKDAADRFNICLRDSWLIGDTTVDIQTGKNAGLKTALVLTGLGGTDGKHDARPDFVAGDVLGAVGGIING